MNTPIIESCLKSVEKERAGILLLFIENSVISNSGIEKFQMKNTVVLLFILRFVVS